MLLAESLERLDGSDWLDALVIAAPPGWEEASILLAEELGCGKVVACVGGAPTRSGSVRKALGEVAEDAAVVLVHDAARPLVSDEVIAQVLAPLGEGWDAAVPALPIADTVKRVDGQAVVETLDRSQLRAAQTPEAFVASVLRDSLAGAREHSDCAALVEARGGRVTVVEGDARLVKVTTRDDLRLAESWLDRSA